MKKIPKLMLVSSMALLTSLSSCHKNDVDPNQLEFLCKEPEKTIQKFTNQEAIIQIVEYSKNNPKAKSSTDPDFLIFSKIFVMSFNDLEDLNKKIIVVPSKDLPKEYQIENKKILFSGEVKNCKLTNSPNPLIDIGPNFDFMIGNKIIITNIKNN
jgi:hypothetical protein